MTSAILAAVMVLSDAAITILNEVEACAVYTETAKVSRQSSAGKTYSSTVRVNYVDANCDGQATAIDLRNAELYDLLYFLRNEFPSEFRKIEPQWRGVGFREQGGRLVGGTRKDSDMLGGDLKQTNAVRDYDNKETYMRVWKQFGRPVMKKTEAALRVAEREQQREKRSKGRSR